MVQPASLFNQLLQHFPRLEFASLVKKHSAEWDAKGSPVGPSSSPCSFVNSLMPIRCARFATVYVVAWASWYIWASANLPINRLSLMLTNTARRLCLRTCSAPP